jgi:hypothetical protein
MKTTILKRITAAGAISGAVSLAALGFGAGVANADNDEGNTPFRPGGVGRDWQSYMPLVENLGDLVNLVPIGHTGNTGSPGSLGNLGNLGNGQWENLLGLFGG